MSGRPMRGAALAGRLAHGARAALELLGAAATLQLRAALRRRRACSSGSPPAPGRLPPRAHGGESGAAQAAGRRREPGASDEGRRAGPDRKVLVAGVYLSDREHLAEEIAAELGRSAEWEVEQRWIALGEAPVPAALAPVTAWQAPPPQPKFALLNRLLREVSLDDYAFVLVCDDDVALPERFVDRYLALVTRHDLALAQPARTHGSYIDHCFVEQLDGLEARTTRFVEIGPVFSMRRDAVRLLTPFDEASPMGWGYDFVWPVVVGGAGLRMGIVDATPVAHALRKSVTHYSHGEAMAAMERYLARNPHLARRDAFFIVEAYS